MAGTAVLRTVTSGQRTVIVALEVLLASAVDASFVAATETVFASGPQSVGSVGPLTVTVRNSSSPRSPNEQLRTPLPSIEHPAVLVVHDTPSGRVSVRVTARAMPGPRLVTVIEKAAVSPALM